MLSEYKQYYSLPTIKHARNLFDAIIYHDFTDDLNELAELRQSVPPQPHLADRCFSTNGTSSFARQFMFGPHSDYWLHHLEDQIKNRSDRRFVCIAPFVISTRDTATINSIDTNIVSITHTIFVNATEKNAADRLISEIAKTGGQHLLSAPSNWLFLMANTTFRHYISNSRISLMSTGSEPFCARPPHGIYINDNMINWSTTMNFYTCQYGTKHFLPTFIPMGNQIVNMLNLACPPSGSADDQMVISGGVHKCQCGKYYRHFTFIPHVNNMIASNGSYVYDTSLAEKLESEYINLQFVQQENTVDILYVGRLVEQDKQLLSAFFSEHGLQPHFIADRFLDLSNKFPPFWKSPTKKYSIFARQGLAG